MSPVEYRGKKPKLDRPSWIKVAVPGDDSLQRVGELMNQGGLHTVCQEAHCPNIYECWQMGTATFLILGEVCTRKCGFCAVSKGSPTPVDPDEPRELAEAAARLNLKHVVITSVDRDDLPDFGPGHWVETIEAIKRRSPETKIEILVSEKITSTNLGCLSGRLPSSHARTCNQMRATSLARP